LPSSIQQSNAHTKPGPLKSSTEFWAQSFTFSWKKTRDFHLALALKYKIMQFGTLDGFLDIAYSHNRKLRPTGAAVLFGVIRLGDKTELRQMAGITYRGPTNEEVAERAGFEPAYSLLDHNPISSRTRYDLFGTSPA
jgi:hypothetical protein